MRTTTSKLPGLNRALLIKLPLFLFLFACYLTSFAKDAIDKTPAATPPFTFVVSGKVVDAQGNGLSGASITEKGTTNATTTVANGNFTITVQGESAILVFTYVSYQTKELSVSPAATSITVEMIPVVGSLEEVIIVGYGTQKKISSTSAVSSVKGEELPKRLYLTLQIQ